MRGWRAGIFVVLVLIVGCGREKITVYRVPKESTLASAMTPAGNNEAPAQPQVQWKATPPGWQQKEPAGMSVLSFAITGKDDHQGELSVMTFPSAGVGPISIVNIVRENSGLPPISEEEFSRMIQVVPIGGEKGSLIDFSSATTAETNAKPNSVMLVLLVHEGASWFFKLAGDAQLVAAQKPAMLDFLKSVSIVSGGGVSPRGHGMASTNTKRVPGDTATLPTTAQTPPAANHPAWEVPAGWKDVPPSQMLLAKFSISGASGNADVTVSSFPGDVGGLLANVNRWRKQAGLDGVTQEEMEKSVTAIDVTGGKATLVDVKGPQSRLIGIIWPRGGDTWFFKMMGDAATTEQEKAAFLKFVQSVR